MQTLDETFFSFTYGGDCVGLSAAKVCIPKIKEEKVPDHLDKVGRLLKDGFNNLADQYQLRDYVECIGYPCRSIISFDGQGKLDELEIKSFFQQELLRRGILWAAYHALSWSHSEEDIFCTLNAYEETLALFKKILDSKVTLRSNIEGKLVEPVFRKVADFNSYTNKNK